jgi:hypothetical protein
MPYVRLLNASVPMGCIGASYNLILDWYAVDRCNNETYFRQIMRVQASCSAMPPPPPTGGGDLMTAHQTINQAVFSKNEDKNFTENQRSETPLVLQTVKSGKICQLGVYPNPTNGLVHFNLNSPHVGDAILNFYDALGQPIGSIKQAYAEKGKDVLMKFEIPSTTVQGLIFYTLSLGNSVESGKIHYIR